MSTRAIIARRTGPTSFEGRYHHWDGGPKILGRNLFLRCRHFETHASMLDVLIDQHPAGWSTINGADFNLDAGYREIPANDKRDCIVCGRAGAEHVEPWEAFRARQVTEPEAERKYDLLGHEFDPKPFPPLCYCHGDRHEEPSLITERDLEKTWCEWAYIFDLAQNVMIILTGDGANEPAAANYERWGPWMIRARVPLDGPEPDWARIECGPNLEFCGHYAWVHFREDGERSRESGLELGTAKYLGREPLDAYDAYGVIYKGRRYRYSGSHSQRAEGRGYTLKAFLQDEETGASKELIIARSKTNDGPMVPVAGVTLLLPRTRFAEPFELAGPAAASKTAGNGRKR